MNYSTRNINIDDFYALVTIPCRHGDDQPEQQHRIGVRTNSSLVFFDHDETMPMVDILAVKAELAPAHACAAQFRYWNQGAEHRLTAVLRSCYNRLASVKQSKRRNNRCSKHADGTFDFTCPLCTDDTLKRPFVKRMQKRVRTLARECLEMADYRRGGKGNEGHHTWKLNVVTMREQPSIKGEMEREWKSSWNTSSGEGQSVPVTEITARVRPTWLTRVYEPGLALVNGNFVLDVVTKRRDGTLHLLVGKQSRGYNVVPAPAIYNPKTEKLQWL